MLTEYNTFEWLLVYLHISLKLHWFFTFQIDSTPTHFALMVRTQPSEGQKWDGRDRHYFDGEVPAVLELPTSSLCQLRPWNTFTKAPSNHQLLRHYQPIRTRGVETVSQLELARFQDWRRSREVRAAQCGAENKWNASIVQHRGRYTLCFNEQAAYFTGALDHHLTPQILSAKKPAAKASDNPSIL